VKVLVACEESQVVCNAFRAMGHEAYSCDLLPTRGDHPEWHIQGDVLSVIVRDAVQNVIQENSGGSDWDLMIAHPPCTYLCNSGVRWLYNKDGTINKERCSKMKDAANFFRHLWLCNIPRICIENPIMHGLGKYEAGVAQCYDTSEFKQIIQPWQFGHGETKATCLWLKNLPKLIPTKIVDGREHRIHKMAPGPNRARNRATTYQGIANAMAEQWGNLDKQHQGGGQG
jgi:hypothetical protein